jgi:ADP-heptose:LPS heptosyltransferase
VIFIWGPGERQTVEALVSRGKHGRLLACRTDLMQLAALIARSHLHIGNCSAPRHLAAAVGTPSLTIMGPTDPKNWTYPSPIHRVIQGKVPCLVCAIKPTARPMNACTH